MLPDYTAGKENLFPGMWRGEQFGQQGGTIRHAADHYMLVDGVRAFTDGAEAIEGGDAERGGKVAIGAATAERFFQLHTQIGRQFSSQAEQPHSSRRAFHGRAVEAAGDLNGAAGIHRPEGAKFLFEGYRVALPEDADVDFGARLCGHDIGAGSPRR